MSEVLSASCCEDFTNTALTFPIDSARPKHDSGSTASPESIYPIIFPAAESA